LFHKAPALAEKRIAENHGGNQKKAFRDAHQRFFGSSWDEQGQE